jgi:hypothetical protein
MVMETKQRCGAAARTSEYPKRSLSLAEHVEGRASLKEAATPEVTLRILKFKFSEGS